MKSSERHRGRPAGRDTPDHRRITLAVEAARLMHEQGLTDFRSAKAKAAERLGLGRNAPLPTNAEIEAALAAHNRIFLADRHEASLQHRRQAALKAMHDLAAYHPRLTGDVLSGHTTEHSTIELHLFCDTVEPVGETLARLGIGSHGTQRRYRLRHDAFETFPACRFQVDDAEIIGVIFPIRMRGHPPLSPVDGRPMHRATPAEVAQLVAAP